MRIPHNVEPPRLVLVLTRVIDPNTRTGSDSPDLQFAIFDPEGTAGEICAIEPLVDPHRYAKLAWTAGDVGLAPGGFSEPSHDSHVVDRLHSADKNRSGVVFRFGNRVQTEVEPIDHVDIRASAPFKHDRGSAGPALRGVAGEVVRSDISFRLDDLSGEILASQPADEDFSKKVLGDFEGGLLEELTFKFHDEMKKEATGINCPDDRRLPYSDRKFSRLTPLPICPWTAS